MAPPRGPRRVLWVVKGDHVGHPHRVRVGPAGHQARRMGDVEHEPGPDGVGDLPERLGLDQARVGGGPGHDQLGPLPLGHVGHLIEVDDFAGPGRVVGGGGDPVGHESPDLAGDAGRRPVGEVAALVEPHGQNGVAGLEESLIGGQIGVGPGVGLHVGVLRSEQGRGPVPGQLLDLVDDPVPAVVTPARVALGVLVGQYRPGGGQNRRRGEVLRGDQLEGRRLTSRLGPQEPRHLGVLGQPGVEG